MDGEQLRAALRDPLLLNFAAMTFATERIYKILLSDGTKLQAGGHAFVFLVFLVGFFVSYIGCKRSGGMVFWLGTILLALCVMFDIAKVDDYCNVERSTWFDWIFCAPLPGWAEIFAYIKTRFVSFLPSLRP